MSLGDPQFGQLAVSNQQYALYLPRVLFDSQTSPDSPMFVRTVGTFLIVDISGFTAMSEMLAGKGKVGSEEVTDILNGAFTELLDIAIPEGGDLLRFGGDALFLLYTGPQHAARACRAAFGMRAALDEFQKTNSPTPLAMSVGLASGQIDGFLAGSDNRELLFVGPTASEVVRLQTAASAGEILVTPATANQVGQSVFGVQKHGGVTLEDKPSANHFEAADLQPSDDIDLTEFIPSRLRKHISLAFNEGEHRPATVAFVKFSGTDAAFDRDPALLSEQLHALVSAAQEAANRHGVAFIASDVNDDGGKLILTTGVPERSEGQGERLVNALRDIVTADLDLPVHIGVARGHVFAGDLGAPYRRVYTVMGDTVNLAARLASQAGPGEIFATARALDQALDTFELELQDPIPLKGKTKPVAPYSVGARIDSTGVVDSSTEIPLVGRSRERLLLQEAAAAASAGSGSAVDIIGPAGSGTTSLLRDLIARIEDSTRILAVKCERYESATAYHAAGQMLRSLLDLRLHADPDRLTSDLTAAVDAHAPDLHPWLPLLADVVGASVPSTPEVEALADEFHQSKLHETVTSLLERFEGPLAIVVDDAQWIDLASRELLAGLVPSIGSRPWLIVMGRRPDDSEPLARGLLTIELEPLTDEEALELVSRVAGEDTPLPFAQAVAERAEGNPFFIVELARAGGYDERGTLPDTIEGMILAKIDRLSPDDRRLLRYASVLGERFRLDLLADAVPDTAPPTDQVDAWIRLSEFVDTSESGRARFRQTIVRDVAYEGLPFKSRKLVHSAIGEALERRATGRTERQAELLSLHFDRAEEWPRSWSYSVMAAQRAAEKHASYEVMKLNERALRAAAELPDLPAIEILAVNESTADVAGLIGLFDEGEAALDRAIDLAGDDSIAVGRLLRKKGFLYIHRGSLDEAGPLLAQSLETLDAAPDSTEATRARIDTMISLAGHEFRRGEYEKCVDWCGRALEAAGTDPEFEGERAHAHYMRSAAFTHLPGRDGTEDARQAIEVFERRNDLVALTNAFNNVGYDAYYKGSWDDAVRLWGKAVDAAEKAGDIVRVANATHNLGEIHLDQGHTEEAESELRHALRIWQGSNFTIGLGLAHANLSRLYMRTGRFDAAGDCIASSEGHFAEAGAAAYVLEAVIRRSELLLFLRRPQEALELARSTITDAEKSSGTEVSRAALLRVCGYAHAALGDTDTAVQALETSLDLAEHAAADYEVAQTLEALRRISPGVDTAQVDRYQEIFRRLGIVSRPVIPIG